MAASPTDSNPFSKFVPGFDFLQGLVKNAGAALPGIGQWVAPTLNPEELEKRIDELRTVQFWLEQNARMLGATIQALEVQRMTLSTLKSMDVPLGALRDSLKIPMPTAAAAAPEPAPKPAPKPAPQPAPEAPPAIDPTQWWTALTQQFTQLATNAMKETAGDAAKQLAGALVKQSFDAAGEVVRTAAKMPGAVAVKAVRKVTTPRKSASAAAKKAPAPRKRKT